MIVQIVDYNQTLLPPLALLLPPSQGNDLKLSHLNDLHADDADVRDDDRCNVDEDFNVDDSDADHRSESDKVSKKQEPARPFGQVTPSRDKPRRMNQVVLHCIMVIEKCRQCSQCWVCHVTNHPDG